MNNAKWAAEMSRKIIRRICVRGDLVLLTPACLGNGDTEEAVDMPLLIDPSDGRTPLLTGASIAGALRAYLREWEHGYHRPAAHDSHTVLLFGGNRQDSEGQQSALVVNDALGTNAGVELRHEVGLDSGSRTAAQDRLFNRELWAAGTRFELSFELVICEEDDEAQLVRALATALSGLQRAEVTLGARKRRGYGLAKVDAWKIRRYDFAKRSDLFDWLRDGTAQSCGEDHDICAALSTELLEDRRRHFDINATFAIDGTLLMAAAATSDGPDKVHIRSRRRDGDTPPVVPGIGLAGALRARAQRIANTLASEQSRADRLVDSIFGPRDIKHGMPSFASPLEVHESDVIDGAPDWVQFRIRIDRFTGGVLPGALFNAQPVTGGQISTCLRLREPEPEHIGLLLLLLKDLWTGDLPLGGESSIGRGRLKGMTATLNLRSPESKQEWKIADRGDSSLAIAGDQELLEGFVSEHLKSWVQQRAQETSNAG